MTYENILKPQYNNIDNWIYINITWEWEISFGKITVGRYWNICYTWNIFKWYCGLLLTNALTLEIHIDDDDTTKIVSTESCYYFNEENSIDAIEMDTTWNFIHQMQNHYWCIMLTLINIWILPDCWHYKIIIMHTASLHAFRCTTRKWSSQKHLWRYYEDVTWSLSFWIWYSYNIILLSCIPSSNIYIQCCTNYVIGLFELQFHIYIDM